jgi:hypothetical protein
MKPLAAATVTAPPLKMQSLGVMPDKQVIALLIVRYIRSIMRGRPSHMGLATRMKIRFVSNSTAHRASHNKHRRTP